MFTIPLLDHDILAFIMSHLLTESNDEDVTLHIMPALFNFLKFSLKVRMNPAVPLFLRITPPSKKIKMSFAPKCQIAQVQT